MRSSRPLLVFALLAVAVSVRAQSSITCGTTSVPPVVRAEGLSERIGDIVYVCTGSPNLPITGNFTVSLNTEITNRLSAGGLLTGIVFTVNSGSGPQPVLMQPLLVNANTLVYNNVSVSLPAQGQVEIRFAGIRANATRVPLGQQIIATLALNGANLIGTTRQLTVGTTFKTLYAGFASDIICAQRGSLLPEDLTFSSLLQAQTALSSTRFTEGFADSFGPRSAWAYLNADSGQRVIVRYSGFPSDARLFVPNVIAGSDTLQPTSGGDFGLAASGGIYIPTETGSLLLARVPGASSSGAGGTPVYTPGVLGSGQVSFDDVSEVQISSGSAYVVYEVVDANPSRIESAQFPTFLGLPPSGNRPITVTERHINLAPLSTVTTSSASEALPRFIAVDPTLDCTLVGDCASILPQLTVDSSDIDLTANSSATVQYFFYLRNTGAGAMHWKTTVAYQSGSGWLKLQPAEGINDTTVQVFANPQGLAAGTYKATLTIDGGPYTTAKTLQVTFTVVKSAAPAPVPVIESVVNAASFAAVPVVPGSLTTVMGSSLSGKFVSASFSGAFAGIIYSDDKQINLLVPDQLPSNAPAQLIINVDGRVSQPRLVNIAPFSPAIFAGVFNQDTTRNSITNPADPSSIVVVFATGLSGTGRITARVHNQDIDLPYYAGPAPGYPGVQQVNVKLPDGLSGLTTDFAVCGSTTETKFCSAPVSLTIR